jgi:hypothetical protein
MGGSVAQIVTDAAPEVSEASQERLQSAAMGAVDYTNLRLSFKQRGDREYEVIAAIDDGPPTTSTFTIPMSDEALQDAIRNLSATRSALTEPATRKVTPVTEHKVTARQFGTTLADALITGGIETMFDDARSKGAVRVRLNMTSEPELLRIPWEYLRRNGKDLASQRDSTIVRELETAEPARPHLVEGKIRMLGVIANPIGDLDVAGEKRRVEEAIAKCRDQIDLEWLEDCTFKSLQRKLQDPYHILHFVGHSAFTAEGESILLLSDENKQKKEVPADAIAQLIGRQNSLQLVVFNSCDGARTTLDDPFAGIATMLVEQGKSAVIAMQFEITDAAAKAFAEELYYCLIDRRYPIDAAVAEARIAMMDVNQIEFATPVLFLRSGNVDLFNFADPPAAALSGSPSTVDVPPKPPSGSPSTDDVPPKPPSGAPSAVDVPPGPPGGGSKRKRWLVGAGGGVAAVVATVAVVAALSSGGDDPGDEASSPGTGAVDATVAAITAIPATIGRESYLAINDCIRSALFRQPYFDATDPELFYVGIDLCDEALTQLEADGLETDPLYVEINDRLDDADILSSFVDDGTDTPADHQAFADGGEGLYELTFPMLRTLRGVDPSAAFFTEELEEEVADEPVEPTSESPEISGYVNVVDDTEVLSVDVPIEWADIDTTPFTLDDGTEVPGILASPSIAAYVETYLTPGLLFTALGPVPSLDELLAEFAPDEGECTDAGIQDYGDELYTGRFQEFTDCDGTGTVFVTVAAVPPDNSFTAVVVMQLVSDADLEVLDQVIATFTVTS